MKVIVTARHVAERRKESASEGSKQVRVPSEGKLSLSLRGSLMALGRGKVTIYESAPQTGEEGQLVRKPF